MTEINVKRDSDGKIFTFYKKVLPHDVTFMPYIYVYNKENDHIVLEIPLNTMDTLSEIEPDFDLENILKIIANVQ